MSDKESIHGAPNDIPPKGMHIRMDRVTVTNSSHFPTQEMPHMACPGMGYIPPSYNGQQVPNVAPLSNASFMPPPPMPPFPPLFNQFMPFNPMPFNPMGMNIPPQFPMYFPVPSAPIPPQFDPPRRPNKDNKKSRKNREPKDSSQRIKKSKKFKSPVRPKNNPNTAPPQSSSPSQGGPAGDSNTPRSRS